MGWQELIALSIVGVTAVAFAVANWRARRKNMFHKKHCHCGMENAPHRLSILFRQRRGERAQVIVRVNKQ